MRQVDINELRQMLVENCMLKISADQIEEEMPLFGPEGVGLDSIDALQLTVAIEKKYGLPIKDPATARQVLQSLGTLRDWLRRQPDAPAAKA